MVVEGVEFVVWEEAGRLHWKPGRPFSPSPALVQRGSARDFKFTFCPSPILCQKTWLPLPLLIDHRNHADP